MAENLVIVESPNKVKKIQSFLDPNKYEVVASVGHVRDLSTQGQFGLGVDLATMNPTYRIPRDKREIIKQIKRLAEKEDTKTILLATDPDREGEAIAWHVEELIKNTQLTKEFNLERAKKLKFKRIVFNEITEDAVLESLKNQKTLNENLIHSQETRRILDRIIGFRLSALTKNKLQARSAGRVKSVALMLIVDRENEIKKFVADHWWTIEGQISKDSTLLLVNKDLTEIKLKTEEEGDKLLKTISPLFKFVSQETREMTVQPPKPLEMATYLIGMFSKHKTSNAAATMVSQMLYEKGLITYPRTDSTRISSAGFIKEAEAYIKKTYGKEFYKGVPFIKKNESSQDAHEAIRPTNLKLPPKQTKLVGNELKAYEYIWNTTLQSMMVEGKNTSIKDVFENSGSTFLIKRTKIKEEGFRIVTPSEEKEKEFKEKQDIKLDLKKILNVHHETKPPGRYNFGSLIKKLKENGIGRPSTYSATTTGLIKYFYITNTKGSLAPTEMGIEVTNLLVKEFHDIINEKYTSEMETTLDEVAEGKKDGKKILLDFWKEFSKRLDMSQITVEQKALELVGRKCETCKDGDLVYRFGRFGKYIACSNFPKCEHREPLVKKEPPKETGRNCPGVLDTTTNTRSECDGKLLIRKSRFNTEFVGCSKWPKCKYVEYPEKPKKEKTTKTKKAK